jgi:hypothetical protein
MWPVVIECISNGRSQEAQGYNRYDHARDEYSNEAIRFPVQSREMIAGRPTRKTSIFWIPGVSKIFKDGQSGTGDVTGSAKPSAGMK